MTTETFLLFFDQTKKWHALLVTHDVSEALMLADRVLLIEDGAIGLDLTIDLPRPRRRDIAELTQLEEQILDRLLTKKNAA